MPAVPAFFFDGVLGTSRERHALELWVRERKTHETFQPSLPPALFAASPHCRQPLLLVISDGLSLATHKFLNRKPIVKRFIVLLMACHGDSRVSLFVINWSRLVIACRCVSRVS